jgi:hypothetical protein
MALTLPAGGAQVATDTESGVNIEVVTLPLSVLRAILAMGALDASINPTDGSLRVTFPSAQSITISSGTVTTVSQLAGIGAGDVVYNLNDIGWADAIRGRIT